jgi:hypothetical protein
MPVVIFSVWRVRICRGRCPRGSLSTTADRWLTNIGWPARLSVTEGRLLVITNGGLDVFGHNGPSGQYQQPMWHVKLPVGMLSPCHAVEMPRIHSIPSSSTSVWGLGSSVEVAGAWSTATFTVCHSGGGADWPQNYVSEVTGDRRMMRSYGGGVEDRRDEISRPICVAAALGEVLVADWGGNDSDSTDAISTPTETEPHRHHRGPGRVMVFDSELRLKKAFPVLSEAVRANDESGTIGEMTSATMLRPTRLCCVPHKQFLVIGTECGRVIVRHYPSQ